MTRFLAKKLLQAFLLVWAVLTIVFLLLEAAPGDPCNLLIPPEADAVTARAMSERYGCDEPAWTRYRLLVTHLATGDPGLSIASGRPVMEDIRAALPHTLTLSAAALLIMFGVGTLLGALQAVKRNTVWDALASGISLILYSMPGFWLGLLLLLLFFSKLHWFPSSQDAICDKPGLWACARLHVLHLALPAATLGIGNAAGVARYMRSSLLEVIHQDYIRTARAKGLPEWRVVFHHALRNALLPILTLIGLSLPFLLSGSVVVEYLFSWPGMGKLIYEGILAQDTPVVMTCFLFYALLVMAGNLFADLACALADPRIRIRA